MIARDLHEGWTVRAASGPAPASVADREIPAVVPGVVHQALLDAELIPDPYLDDNESALAWIGLVDWSYRVRVVPTAEELAAERLELAFDGLDTVAEVRLDGRVVAAVANQHRRHRVDVTGLIGADGAELEVAFRSPVRYADAQSMTLGPRPRPYPVPFEAIRKSACSFGWDWGIATATSGVWRSVRLEAWSTARLAETRVAAIAEGAGGSVEVAAVLDVAAPHELSLELEVGGTTHEVIIPAGADRATVRVELDEVERWWPVGYGEQPLSDVLVRLRDGDTVLDETQRRVGFRTVRWDTEPDADGSPFQLIVNDQPVWVKGVNWIPDDALFPRVDRVRYARRLTQARDAGVNLVRVWGGGIFEDDTFYDLADELGLLTWQDFLMACAAYPEEEPIRSEIVAEARDNVVRLAHHASLVLLTGNNENLWGYEDWGWKTRLDGATWGAYYYYEAFPEIIAELASHVPYSPGSPFSPDEGLHPNDETSGTTHLWEQWNREPWTNYLEHAPRFVAEFGWQGPPAWSTLTRSLSDDPLTPESPGMLVHQKAIDGNQKLVDGLLPHYRVPRTTEDWHWAMQLNQANAVGFALDHFRSHAPRTSGAIVWQLNDCWPVTSWAAIDGDGRAKPLRHALAAAFAPRVLSIQPRESGLVAVIGNDTAEAWTGELILARRGFDGAVLAEVHEAVEVPPRASLSVSVPPAVADPEDPTAELLTATLGGVRGVRFLLPARATALPEPVARVSVAADGDSLAVTVVAETLLRDLTLLVDRVSPDAEVDAGLVTLLPGESATFHVRGAAGADAEAFADPRVLRTANQLVAGVAP
ncbi:glycoside hydrolase family 2 protein [Homoserinibacter sp. GY 40078]|uniref:glycoside hydrolase family 2 protein n=1 Tax=Homoserinibacter sp. GY 40078 TaxID=2603275 RepID=UPI0011C76BF8|nr:glycoside hydrolase family 2 protein [Homoserinibacter sp. GY 40078]TXK18654.1 glycoside hydrolase family 2 protein [Homoserinibacter sp. GY 40078]